MEEVIRFHNLSFTYPDGRQALKHVNVKIYNRERVAVVGPNGAGKSTFLLHLNGTVRSNGAITIFGLPVAESNLKEIRRRVGFVFQEPDDQLFSPTVFDDVAFGPINLGYTAAEVKRRVTGALEAVGMRGYETRSCHHLSVGEKKRIAIATVLSMDPELLVLDEPTSNLDPRNKYTLVELLRRLQITMVVATHDLELVKELCQRTVILDAGVVVADDGTTNILSNTPLLRDHGLARPESISSCTEL